MKKDEILAKARALFESQKDSGREHLMRLGHILQEIGISKGNFYYYFKDKDDLLYQVISPIIAEQTEYFRKNIKRLKTLREQVFLLFEPLVVPNSPKAKHLEDMYRYLFFEDGIVRSEALRKIHIEVVNKRKSLLLQAIKANGIKPNKRILTLLEYVDNTIIFYHIRFKKLHGKPSHKEVAEILELMVKTIETIH